MKVIFPNSGKRIRHMYSEPAQPKPEGAALRAIDEADVIISLARVAYIQVSFRIC